MYKNRFFMQLGIFFFSLFLLSGCGENNSQSVPNTAPDVDSNGTIAIAKLSIAGGDVTVSQNDEAVSIRVKALSKDDALATSGTILAQYLEPDSDSSGDLTPSQASISEGFATFIYTAPKDIQNQIDSGNNGTSFKFYSKDDVSVSTTVNIIFDTTVDTVSSDPISKLILSESTINISQSLETKEITIRGLKADNTAVVNGKVVIQYPSTGNIDAGTVPAEVSIIDGLGTFSYVAPVDIINAGTISPAQFKIYDKTNPTVSTTLNVNFAGGGTVTPRLSVSNGDTLFTKDSETSIVKILATDTRGVPLQSGTIQVRYPTNTVNNGLFTASEVDIVNGVASFAYTGPSPIYSGSATFIFEFKENPIYSTTWLASFQPEAGAGVVPITNLAVNPHSTTLISDSQSVQVQVLAFTSGNLPAQSGSIQVKYPTDVNTKNIGTVTPAEVEINNGIATFTYRGPATLVSDINQTFSFVSKEFPTISADFIISYSPLPDTQSPVVQTVNIAGGGDVNVTKNSEVISVDVRVFGADNNPFLTGNVKVGYPIDAVNGVDVGYFSALEVPVENGRAIFTYNAPSDLSTRNGDKVKFKFYHDSNPQIEKSITFTYVPDPNQIVITSYALYLSTSDGNNTMGLESTKVFTSVVKDEDGNEITDANYTVTNLNPDFGNLMNDSGVVVNPLVDNGISKVTFRLDSKTKSGLIPLKVKAVFVDVNGDIQTIEKVFNVVIFSGPPTSISISYASTGLEADRAKFVEHMVITVVDKYFNPVNTRPGISVGAIIGYVGGGGSPANYMYYEPDNATTGVITPGNFNVPSFAGGAKTFDDGDYNNDVLAVFGKGFSYDASGKWDVSYVDSTNLKLLDDYDGVSRSNLGFALGNNQRPVTCSPGQEKVGFVEVEGGEYLLDDRGMAKIAVTYDYYLTGKDIVLWTNIVGFQADLNKTVRIGESQKITLRGHGLQNQSLNIAKLTSGTYIFYLGLSDVEFENYYDGRFISNVETSGTVSISNVSRLTLGDCSSSGQVYFKFDYNGGSDGGTVSIKPVIVNEF